MSEATSLPRALALLERLDAWAGESRVRVVVVRVVTTVAGPLLVLAGVAMLVLPGPGLVTMAAGLAILAVEYPWARRVLEVAARELGRLKRALFPTDASAGRRVWGGVLVAAFAVAGFASTTLVTAYLGSRALL